MSWTIIWSQFAEEQLDTIYNYYHENAGIAVSQKLLVEIIAAPEFLKSNPQAGQIELNLQHLEKEYRFIVHKNYKILYSTDFENQTIQIADVFDSRQNPTKLERNK